MGIRKNRWLIAAIFLVAVITITILLGGRELIHIGGRKPGEGSFLPWPGSKCIESTSMYRWLPPQVALTMVHYARSNVSILHTSDEITVTLKLLAGQSPCNLVVFGLGADSPLWTAFNYGGRTVFLEDNQTVINNYMSADLEVYRVNYTRIKVREAEDVLRYSRSDEACRPVQNLRLSKCRLAVKDLGAEIYSTDWDVIMIDEEEEEDGGGISMSAIYSAAVMGRNRKKVGSTDILLHHGGRTATQRYAKDFLCMENLVSSVDGLWHFRVSPATTNAQSFCFSPMS